MRKVILMLAMCGLFAGVQAQTKKSDRDYNKTGMSSTTYTQTPTYSNDESVPQKVRDAFDKSYKHAKATWKKEGENFRAWFKSSDKDALETIVVYDKNGNKVMTEKELVQTSVPSEINAYCTEHDFGKMCHVWEVDSKNGPKKYYAVHDGETTWFDSNGNKMMNSGIESGTHHVAHHKVNYRSK